MKSTLDNLILKQIYCKSLMNRKISFSGLCRELELPPKIIEPNLKNLLKNGSVQLDKNDSYHLTKLGRKQLTIVLTGGVFDLLHVGHIFTFQQAKLLGDVLVVVITTDNWVQKQKKRLPANPQKERAQVVAHIKQVDVVMIGDEKDFMIPVAKVDPDIIALGYDQYFKENELEKQLEEAGHGHVKVVRLSEYVPGKSTSKIVQEIIQRNIHQ